MADNELKIKWLKDRVTLLKEKREGLCDLANGLSGNDTGAIAACIHVADGKLLVAIAYLEERIKTGKTPEAAEREAIKSFMQSLPMAMR